MRRLTQDSVSFLTSVRINLQLLLVSSTSSCCLAVLLTKAGRSASGYRRGTAAFLACCSALSASPFFLMLLLMPCYVAAAERLTSLFVGRRIWRKLTIWGMFANLGSIFQLFRTDFRSSRSRRFGLSSRPQPVHCRAYTQAPFDAARPCGRCCSGGAGICGGCPTAVLPACFSARPLRAFRFLLVLVWYIRWHCAALMGVAGLIPRRPERIAALYGVSQSSFHVWDESARPVPQGRAL